MQYMIVDWDSSSKCWVILHYSHNLNDAQKMFKRCRVSYPACQLMVDYEQITQQGNLAKYLEFHAKIQASLGLS